MREKGRNYLAKPQDHLAKRKGDRSSQRISSKTFFVFAGGYYQITWKLLCFLHKSIFFSFQTKEAGIKFAGIGRLKPRPTIKESEYLE